MDRAAYVAMTGAKHVMLAQGLSGHNMANAGTPGFRADLYAFASSPVYGPGHPSRVNGVVQSSGWDASGGEMESTGRELDIAVQGTGFIAVQTADGSEAYTRAGDLRVTAEGLLTTGAGHRVLGSTAPIALPPYAQLTIGADGTISVVPLGQSENTVATVDRIKLVDPTAADLVKGPDGLLRTRDGKPLEASASVQVATGTLEASNVNAAESMVAMIELARTWDLNVKLIESSERNGAAAASLATLGQ
jgi:flagellar basal-body rod protein FlgF